MSSTEGLDSAALADFRRQLLAMKRDAAAAVEARLHGHGEHRHDEAGLPRHADETDDDAAAETQRQADVTHLARTATALREIEAALGRIEAGEYGQCMDCEEPIDVRRLQAHPAALRCARCQQSFETQQNRAGAGLS
jgi:RNA polymerase-binding protein DksA